MSTSRCDPHKIHADAATYCMNTAPRVYFVSVADVGHK